MSSKEAEAVHDLQTYCALEKVSRSKVYSEWAAGGGVEYFRRGKKILISEEARIRHRRALERKAKKEREMARLAASASDDGFGPGAA